LIKRPSKTPSKIESRVDLIQNHFVPITRIHRHPRRPPRLEWLFSHVHPLYFITFNTYKRLTFLARPEIHETFSAFCIRAQEHNVAVGRYVLMPDHVHLFVAIPPQGITVVKWVQALRSVVGKTLLALGFEKPHWQEGFFDHVLRTGESYSQKWDYVRMNPVRAGLCERPEEWPYQGEIVRLQFD
jgi:REP element-mobilizing transposase RayT